MKTAEKPSPRQLAETLSPETVQLYRLLAPFVSIGRQGTGITHNLNSPLTGLMGHLELMKLKNPELSNDLDIIMGLAKKLRDNIANLQSKYEKETNKEVRSINVNDMLRTTLANLQADLFFKHYIHSEVDFQSDLPGISGSYADFALSFEEILINAIDVQRDQKEGYIGVKTYADEKLICIEIEDDGSGFSDDALEKAFEPFWPEMTSLEDGRVHVGMGLYLCQAWLKPYGAKIELENRPTKGALVRVTLPFNEE